MMRVRLTCTVALALAGTPAGFAQTTQPAASDDASPTTQPAATTQSFLPAGEPKVTASGMKYWIVQEGPADGREVEQNDFVEFYSRGMLEDGTEYDNSRLNPNGTQQLMMSQITVKGLNEALDLMSEGDVYKFWVPSELGFGAQRRPNIPPNSNLITEFEIVKVVKGPELKKPTAEQLKEGPAGLKYQQLAEGTGKPIAQDDIFTIVYTAWTEEGKLFLTSKFNGNPLKGNMASANLKFFQEVLPTLKKGSKVLYVVPPEHLFGENPGPNELPPNSTTYWELEVTDVTEPLKGPEFKQIPDNELTSTKTGLQIKHEKEGTGASPKMGDSVTVHYAGFLTDGKPFDSSFKRGEPATFMLGQVIAGWNEGLQLMKEGGSAWLVIPSDLAYGEMGRPPTIPPDSTLVFYVELQKVTPGGQ